MKSFVAATLIGTSFVTATPTNRFGYGNKERRSSVVPFSSYAPGLSTMLGVESFYSSGAPNNRLCTIPSVTATLSTPAAFSTGIVQNEVFSFPLSNGFPNLTDHSASLLSTEQQAHGTLSNAPPPLVAPKPDDLTSLKLIAFNELHEVAFFTELLGNITTGVSGYEFENQNHKVEVMAAIAAIQAQEELHALNANGALAHFAADSEGPITPCQYSYPVAAYADAIALAATFTDVILGTLGDVQTLLGSNGDVGLLRGVAAVIGQEGQQTGWFRAQEGKIPSELPFLTASARAFAFNAIVQDFIVPGSCPYDPSHQIGLPLFSGTLILQTPGTITLKDQILEFAVKNKDGSSIGSDGLSLVYVNQQNLPITIPIQSIVNGNDIGTFSASFPAATNLFNGLTIAVVVNGHQNFTNIDDVASATTFGPLFIEIN